jgi:drug/metabolite transporter (DMT)-like permease
MIAAFLSALLFAISAMCGHRTATKIGGVEANFWRIALATIFLTIWANFCGAGFAGLFGIGLGDSAYFQALPRLGSRRTVLLVQCLTAPFAALIEWLWLGAKLNLAEIFCIAIILGGVAIALKPGDYRKLSARDWQIGIVAGIVAALGGALGAVIIRKGYAALHAGGLAVDAGTTGYQRMLGGILFPAIALLVFKWRSAHAHGGLFEQKTLVVSGEKWRRIWPWVLANALAGQTLGVTCMQWALAETNAAIVAAIIALTPIFLLPMTRLFEGEKIGVRSLVGAFVAVGGVIGLAFSC